MAPSITVRLVRFCSAMDQLRFYIPLLSAFILLGRPLLLPRHILTLFVLVVPFTFLMNAIRISIVVAYATWRSDLGLSDTMTASQLHAALGGGRFLVFGNVLLYCLYRFVRRVRITQTDSENE